MTGLEIGLLVGLGVLTVGMVVAALNQPKPAKPKAGEIESQGAEEGKAVPVVYGTNRMAMNITYDGATKTKPYKKKGGKK